MLVQLSFQINSSDDSHLDSEVSRGFICSPLMLLVDPSLNPITWESRRCLLIQNTQPTGQWKGHAQLKEAAKEGKKKKREEKKRNQYGHFMLQQISIYI